MICKPEFQQEVDAQVVDQEEEDVLFVSTCFSSNGSTEGWLIDSGYTNNMTHNKELFKELKKAHKLQKLELAMDNICQLREMVLLEFKGFVEQNLYLMFCMFLKLTKSC